MKQIINSIIFTLIFSITLYSQDLPETNKEVDFALVERPYMTISPFIKHLLKMNEVDLQKEMNDFWIKTETLPLIEYDSLDNDYIYLTIIYRDNTSNKEISFEIFGIYDEYRLGDMKLRHLSNTDFYYRCYKFPKDICFSYRFIIYDTISKETIKITDKYNPLRIPYGEIKNYSYSVFDLTSTDSDWNIKRYDNVQSTIDTLLYTDKVVKKERNIYVYLPPGYDKQKAEPYPVIYLFDAFIYLNRVELPNILDNLITEGKIKPMVAVLFDTYRSTRGVILPLNFEFKDEFVNVVVPLIRSKYNVSLLPEKNIIGGMSFGGLAAGFMAFYHPDIFGNVLGQSSSFWRDLEYLDTQGEWIRGDWLINKYSTSNKKKLKFYLDWGLQENWVLDSNRKMVKILNGKGYDVKFTEFNGWHDWSNSRKTFADGLMYLLR